MAGMTAALVAATVISGAVTAGSQIQQGRVQNAVSKIQAGQMMVQAEAKKAEIEATKLEAEVQEQNRQQQLRGLLSSQAAAMAASGFSLTSGSFQAMQDADISQVASQRKFDDMAQKAREISMGSDVRNMQTQASIERSIGKNAQKSGYIGAGVTLLNTGVQTTGAIHNARISKQPSKKGA